MKFRAGLKVTVALAALSLAAACAQTDQRSKSEITAQKVQDVFGGTDRSGNGDIFGAYDDDRQGFFLFRAYSDTAFPNRYLPTAGDSYKTALVVDVALDFEVSKGFPLYRIGLRPRKLEALDMNAWPDYVVIDGMSPEGHPTKLVARLPQDRSLDRNGMIWSDVTYCSECFDLSRISKAAEEGDEAAFKNLELGRAAAGMASAGTSGFEGELRFVAYAEKGIMTGSEARRMAPIANAEIAVARTGVNMMAPSRAAYFDFKKAYAEEPSPAYVAKASCGEYAPSDDPAVPAAWQSESIASYVSCMARTLDNYLNEKRELQINELREQEEKLAKEGLISADERLYVASFEEEVRVVHEIMKKARKDYADWKAESKAQESSAAPVLDPKPIPERVREQLEASQPASEMVPPTDGSKAEVSTIGLEKEATAPTTEALPAGDIAPTPAAPEEVGEPLCAISFLCPDEK